MPSRNWAACSNSPPAAAGTYSCAKARRKPARTCGSRPPARSPRRWARPGATSAKPTPRCLSRPRWKRNSASEPCAPGARQQTLRDAARLAVGREALDRGGGIGAGRVVGPHQVQPAVEQVGGMRDVGQGQAGSGSAWRPQWERPVAGRGRRTAPGRPPDRLHAGLRRGSRGLAAEVRGDARDAPAFALEALDLVHAIDRVVGEVADARRGAVGRVRRQHLRPGEQPGADVVVQGRPGNSRPLQNVFAGQHLNPLSRTVCPVLDNASKTVKTDVAGATQCFHLDRLRCCLRSASGQCPSYVLDSYGRRRGRARAAQSPSCLGLRPGERGDGGRESGRRSLGAAAGLHHPHGGSDQGRHLAHVGWA